MEQEGLRGRVPRYKKETTKVTVYVDTPLWKAMRHLAIDKGVSVSSIVEEAFRDKLQKEGRLPEESPGHAA